MEFVRVLRGYDHLWSVKIPEMEADELTLLFRRWSRIEYLLDFFLSNVADLKEYFQISSISEAIKDSMEDACMLERMILAFPSTENLDTLFRPLGELDMSMTELTREKARNWWRHRHPSWLRVYAIRLEANVFVITGGAIKLTPTMQERCHTEEELTKMNTCREYLRQNGVFDQASFMDKINNK